MILTLVFLGLYLYWLALEWAWYHHHRLAMVSMVSVWVAEWDQVRVAEWDQVRVSYTKSQNYSMSNSHLSRSISLLNSSQMSRSMRRMSRC
jgi:hypothetical protein